MIELLLGILFSLCFVAGWSMLWPRERNRDERGRFVADNPKTLTDEAWRRK